MADVESWQILAVRDVVEIVIFHSKPLPAFSVSWLVVWTVEKLDILCFHNTVKSAQAKAPEGITDCFKLTAITVTCSFRNVQQIPERRLLVPLFQ